MSSLQRLIIMIKPDEVYNLAAQTHVRYSFDHPVSTAESVALGTIRLLEAIRICGMHETIRYYQVNFITKRKYILKNSC